MVSVKTRQTVIPLWKYRCPQCGVGDQETGSLASDHAIYCEVCIEDSSYVRLDRWPEA